MWPMQTPSGASAYHPDADVLDADAGQKVVSLPAHINHHWTKNLLASRDGTHLYVTVGSNSNIGENGMEAEAGRAAIWEIDPAAGRIACSPQVSAIRSD